MTDTPQVLIFPRGQLTAKDKKALEGAGIVAVEADDPAAVVCPVPIGSVLGSDDVLFAALAAVHESSTNNMPRTILAEKLYSLILKKREGIK